MSSNLDPQAHLHRAAEAIGGQAAIAALLGYATRQGVQAYFAKNGRPLQAEHCPLIEEATRAKAREKNDPSLIVTCEQLRPDVAWGVLREPAALEVAKA